MQLLHHSFLSVREFLLYGMVVGQDAGKGAQKEWCVFFTHKYIRNAKS